MFFCFKLEITLSNITILHYLETGPIKVPVSHLFAIISQFVVTCFLDTLFCCPTGKTTQWSDGWLEAEVKGITLGCWTQEVLGANRGIIWLALTQHLFPGTPGPIKIHQPISHGLLTRHGAKTSCMIQQDCLEGKQLKSLAFGILPLSLCSLSS